MPELLSYKMASTTAPTTAAPTVEPTDGERLMRYVQHREEQAFVEVVESHSAMVWGVCWHVLRQRQDTEDAYQATFLILARKAQTIRANESAAAWLYRVAFRTALRLKNRRRRRAEVPLGENIEESALDATNHTAPSSPSEQLAAVARCEQISALLEELHALPVRYQRPLVLRYLEAKSRAAVAEELGCTTAAVKGRLARGRSMLRSRLARRGVALSTAMALTTTGLAASAAAMPLGLAATAAGPALAFSLGKASPGVTTSLPHSTVSHATAQAVALAKQGLTAMTIATTLKPAAGVLAVVLASALLATAVANESEPKGTAAAPTNQPSNGIAVGQLLKPAEDPNAINLRAAADLTETSRAQPEPADVDVLVEPPARDPRAASNQNPSAAGTADPRLRDRGPAKPDRPDAWSQVPQRSQSPVIQPPQPLRAVPPTLSQDRGPQLQRQPSYGQPTLVPTTLQMPAGGKSQLELERKYWMTKAQSLKFRAQAVELKRQVESLVAEERTAEARVAQRRWLEMNSNAETHLALAESYLAQSKAEEVAGKIMQLEQMEKRQAAQPVPTPQPVDRRARNAYNNGRRPQPASHVLPPGEYIRPGDRIRIEVLLNKQNLLNEERAVDAQGRIRFHESYAHVTLANLAPAAAEQKLLEQFQEHMTVRDIQLKITKINRDREGEVYRQAGFETPGQPQRYRQTAFGGNEMSNTAYRPNEQPISAQPLDRARQGYYQPPAIRPPKPVSDKISVGDLLKVEVVNALDKHPINEVYVVEPAGTVALGAAYGRAKVLGHTLVEAEEIITKLLKEQLEDPKVQVTRFSQQARLR